MRGIWGFGVALLIVATFSVQADEGQGGNQGEYNAVFKWQGPISEQTYEDYSSAPAAKEDGEPVASLKDVWSALKTFACTVPGYGGTVAVIDKPDLNNLSYAERIGSPPRYELVIYVRTDILKKFALPTRLFWLEHECAHHTLGQTMETQLPPPEQLGREEVEADCRGIRTLAATITNDDGEIATVIREMTRLRGGRGYPTGDQRAACLQVCLDRSDLSEQDVAVSCY